MKLSIFVLCFLSVQTFEKDSVVSGFQVQQPLTIQSVVPRTITTTRKTTTTTTAITNSHHPHPPTALYNVFGGLFDVGSRNKKTLSEEPLTIYSATTTTMEDEDQVFNSLGEYIEEWSKLITNGSIALTTPVTVERVVPNPEDTTTRHRGIRLLFKDTRSEYKSKTEEKESNPTASSTDVQDNNDNKKKKSKKQKQGGVEILVEKKNNGVQVTAKRCEVEEDTIIKEMSEETIIHELKEALQVWKREHSK